MAPFVKGGSGSSFSSSVWELGQALQSSSSSGVAAGIEVPGVEAGVEGPGVGAGIEGWVVSLWWWN